MQMQPLSRKYIISATNKDPCSLSPIEHLLLDLNNELVYEVQKDLARPFKQTNVRHILFLLPLHCYFVYLDVEFQEVLL